MADLWRSNGAKVRHSTDEDVNNRESALHGPDTSLDAELFENIVRWTGPRARMCVVDYGMYRRYQYSAKA